MSRDMQLYNSSHLPATQEDLFHQTTALGMPGGVAGAASAPPPSPIKKIQRLLRGREKLAICLALLGAIVGGAHLFVEELLHVAEDVGIDALVLSLILAPLATELPDIYDVTLISAAGIEDAGR